MTKLNGSDDGQYTITFTTTGPDAVDIAVTGFPADPDADLPTDAGAKVCLRVLELMTVSGMLGGTSDGETDHA